MPKTLTLGELIEQKIEDSGIPKTKIAHKLDIDVTNLYRIFDKESMNTDLLIRISEVMDYNFIWELLRDPRLKRIKKPVDLSKYSDETLEAVLHEPEVMYGKLREENEQLKSKLIKAYEKNQKE